MRTLFFVIIIVCVLVMFSPVLVEAGKAFRERYQAIFFGGHDPEKVKELRDQDV